MSIANSLSASAPSHFSWPSSLPKPETVAWLQEAVLPAYFKKCRWFAGKARRLKEVRIKQSLLFDYAAGSSYILIVDAYYRTGKLEQYLLPVTYVPGTPESPEKSVLCPLGKGFLIDAVYAPAFRAGLFEAFGQQAHLQESGFTLAFEKGIAFEQIDIQKLGSRVLNADQSNTSLFFGEHFFFKFYRKLFRLTNPELEVVRFLSEQTNFKQIPTYAASLSLHKAGTSEITLGIMQQKVASQGDAWALFQEQLTRFIEQDGLEKLQAIPQNLPYLDLAQLEANANLAAKVLDTQEMKWIDLLGQRTAEMHNALASRKDVAAFAPVAFDADYQDWLSGHFDRLLEKRQQLLGDVQQHLSAQAQPLARKFQEQIDLIRAHFEHIQQLAPVSKRIRIHGDYHLGQVLYHQNDYIILDFEGEPESSISDRKIKHSPLKDVAGMLRSFHYAAYVALYFGPKAAAIKQKHPKAEQLAETWFQLVASVYLKSYFTQINRDALSLHASAEVEALLRLHLLEKAVYEFGYELNGRPDWAIIPLKGIQQILGEYQNE
ncbi:MAG: putative maltokinase [Sphingobacteriaceae bacterium]|nr:putative maltokinase [Sphingobacteriaceae bacterium]